ERAEIKDALGYLRLMMNRYDDAAFERVINTPTRGIGNTTLATVREFARNQNFSLWQAVVQLLKEAVVTSRAAQALRNFVELIERLDEETKTMSLGDLTEHVIQQSGLYQFYQLEKSEKSLSRLENLDELVNATRQFAPEAIDEHMQPLVAFLTHAA